MEEKYQKVIRGRGSIGKVTEMAGKLGVSRPMIVGTETLIARMMKKAPGLLNAPVFTGYHPNPDLEDAKAGADMYLRQGCDALISVGGGSAMDTAKAVKVILYAGGTEEAASGKLPETMETPHIAIPGTAGTGAEATQNAVVYREGKKLSLSHPCLRPEGVILDAELLESLPAYHKKAGALDALCQGIESWWCRAATEESRVHAFLAIRGVLDNLKEYLAGDPHAAEEMLDASYQSGKAIQITRTTAAHAMSYLLTKTMGYAHGHACMLTLPVLWERMLEAEDMRDVMRDLSEKMRCGDPRMVPRLLRGMMYSLEMEIPPMPDAETLNRLADGVNTERLGNHPVKMSREDVLETYRQSFMSRGAAEKQACIDIWEYYQA